MEETTTDAATQEPGAINAQPDEQTAEAVQTADSEPTTTTTQPDDDAIVPDEEPTEQVAPADTSEDESDLSAWAEKKGIDLNSKEGQAKALKSMREAEKKMHQSTANVSELQKQLTSQPVSVDSDNPLVQELANEVVQMKRSQAIQDFASDVNLTPDQEKVMADYLVSNPAKVQLINAGYMTLNDAYQLSGANTTNPAAIKRQGGQEALERLANKQRATAPSGNAVQATPSRQADAFLDGFDSV